MSVMYGLESPPKRAETPRPMYPGCPANRNTQPNIIARSEIKAHRRQDRRQQKNSWAPSQYSTDGLYLSLDIGRRPRDCQILPRGSGTVISTARPVKEAGADAMVRALYGHAWSSDPTQSLRAAQLPLSAADVDWAAFRVLSARSATTSRPCSRSSPTRSSLSRPSRLWS